MICMFALNQIDTHTHIHKHTHTHIYIYIYIYIFTFHIFTIFTGFMKTIIMSLLLILSYEFHYILI